MRFAASGSGFVLGLVWRTRLADLPNVKKWFLLLVGPGGKTNGTIVGQLCPYDLWEQSELFFRQTGSNVIQLEHFPIWRRRRFGGGAAEKGQHSNFCIFWVLEAKPMRQ